MKQNLEMILKCMDILVRFSCLCNCGLNILTRMLHSMFLSCSILSVTDGVVSDIVICDADTM